ncbi:WD40 repeat-containing protein [Tieghemostelium lacteum]|uniref:WD40 repeat-containing protein n=1 Tax=Tieghemostelium lacteum TaxID=361077 RepID=A0A151Z8F1_TIELA|nr:WD40 repeat-containing protein [Tieghemostelium lacteum]|eukprot:KYQ90249.1 WD40 repeat-containing protein [Tieghemostelium lacteum]
MDKYAGDVDFTQFKTGVPMGASWRPDGKVVVVGGEESLVRVLDVKTRAALRTFQGHKATVGVTRFLDRSRVVSGSHDGIVKLWDVESGSQIQHIGKHDDQVRCSSLFPDQPDLFITGSYDHRIKLWDTRLSGRETCVAVFDHQYPVEDIQMMPNGRSLVSVGNVYYNIWDLNNYSEKPLQTSSPHNKTITSVYVNPRDSRFYTSSLDKMVKVHNTLNFNVTKTLRFKTPLISVIKHAKYFIVGDTNGTVTLHHIEEKQQDQNSNVIKVSDKKSTPSSSSSSTSSSSSSNQLKKNNENSSTIIEPPLSRVDMLLKRYEHKAAFDTSLFIIKKKDVFFKVVSELERRDALNMCLENRDDKVLVKLLQMIKQLVNDNLYTHTGVQLMDRLIDLYQTELQVKPLDKYILEIQASLKYQTQQQDLFLSWQGALELIYQNQTTKTLLPNLKSEMDMDIENIKEKKEQEQLEQKMDSNNTTTTTTTSTQKENGNTEITKSKKKNNKRKER